MFKHLLEPGKIGNMTLRNHVIMGPTETHFATSDGQVTQREIDYYVRRAKGGVGLIVTHQIAGNTKLDPIDPYPRSLRLDDNAYIPMLCELTEAVHLEGAKIAPLVSPGGGAQALGTPYDSGSESVYDIPNVGPSEIQCPVAQKKVRKLTVDEIKKSVEVFGLCARRAKIAGFDAFYIHAHCGYLIAEFLSPYFNNRDDEYGGSLENRARFLLELVASCKKNAGDDFPIVVRMAIDEYIGEAGRGVEETVKLAKMLEKAGVAAIDCGAGLFMTMPLICPTIYHEKGCLVHLAEAIKNAVSIPVIAQGRLQDPELAEQVLADGKADFVSLSRAWIAEPDWVNKIKAGDQEGIRRCVSCNHCIGNRIFNNLTIRCALNPTVGRESKYGDGIPMAAKKKHVVVIGAGPAGLEVSYMLVMRGHSVDLYEKSGELCGGQIKAAMCPPGKSVLANIQRFYNAQFSKIKNLTVHFNYKMTEEKIASLHADAVVLATGGQPVIPKIPGLSLGENIVTADDVLIGKSEATGRVLVAGGGQIGIETAHYLREKGMEVGVVELLPELAMNEEPLTRLTILPIIAKSGIEVYTSHKIQKVENNKLTALDINNNETKKLSFDTLVLAFGTKPVRYLEDSLKSKFQEYYMVGDAVSTANIQKAIESGFFTALKI
ncbi:FAD-dependent oxidoreductase [Clostridium estertheticum]|uniref:FAD-dependent oxidoreductase n=1 Tax=Clostridium estertheticum TaxID=238834 RepID=A0AA47EIZ7_9CLOT|nr:FAD-dependent oxidoreductase [Clostridium estertheticum]MBU3154401.1 FAD-dependent oxidoreductase [Clostridium estertheticum]WAG60289.1 FAD-dependent oxidoreductase [Clostridium estertheticum]